MLIATSLKNKKQFSTHATSSTTILFTGEGGLMIFFLILLLFKYSCLHFPATTFPYLTHPHLPPSILPPLAFSMDPLYMFLDDPSPSLPHYPPFPFSLVTICIYLCLEKVREKEREININVGFLLCTPNWGPGSQPRHVPWLGIEPVTLWFTGWHSIYWATPARATHSVSNTPFHLLLCLSSSPFSELHTPVVPD